MKWIMPFLIMGFLVLGCERQELMDSPRQVVQEETEHVYIFGKKATGVSSAPYTLLCWKDFAQVSIDQVPAGRAPYPRKAFSDGSSVYLVGSHADPSTGGNTGRMACYWKNGVRKTLTAAEGSYVHGACLSEGTLYIYGNDGSSNCIWVNDTKYTLSGTISFYAANDIAVTSSAIVLVGVAGYPDSKLGCWTIPLPLGDSATPLSGTFTDLNGTDTRSGAFNAYVMNDEVIIAGFRNYGGATYPALWRNGTCSIMGYSSTASSDTAAVMFVFGDASSPACIVRQGISAGAASNETVLIKDGAASAVPFPVGYTTNQSWTGAAATSDGYVITGYSEASFSAPYIARYWDGTTSGGIELNDTGDTVNSFQAIAVTVGKGW